MSTPYPLEVITPERVLVTENVQMTIAPASEGDVGILAGHASFLSALRPGEVRIIGADPRSTIRIVVRGGFISVGREKTTILADAAERVDEIDLSRAEIDLAEARRLLQELSPGSNEAIQAEIEAAHAEARIRAARN